MMQLHQTYSNDGPPECSYLYAEIDVVAKRKNKVPEPSSTEDIDHHVYAVLEQPSNQVANYTVTCTHSSNDISCQYPLQSTNTDMDKDDIHPADAQD